MKSTRLMNCSPASVSRIKPPLLAGAESVRNESVPSLFCGDTDPAAFLPSGCRRIRPTVASQQAGTQGERAPEPWSGPLRTRSRSGSERLLPSSWLPSFIATTGRSAPVPRIGTLALAGLPLERLPCHRGDRFQGSVSTPGSCSRRLHARHHMTRTTGTRHAVPGATTIPGFDVVSTVSALHQRFTCVRLHEPHLPRSARAFYTRRSPQRLLTAAGWASL
jgi:hypothetical protein